MNKKAIIYTFVFAAIFIIAGVSTVSAMGMGLFGIGTANLEEMAERHQNMFNKQAELIGVSVDEVKNAWAQGKTMWQLAEEKGISKDQLNQKMVDSRKQQMQDQLNTLVSKGIITQAQADQRLQFVEQMPKNGKMGGGFMHRL